MEQTIFTSTSICKDKLFTAINPDVRVWDALSRSVKDACFDFGQR
jgi:hypothetical protein